MYHSCIGLLYLTWVLFSFCCSERLFFFVSSAIILPVYGWVFIISYGMRTPGLINVFPFSSCADYFVKELDRPMVEQTITFLVLTLLFMSTSSLKMAY